MPKKAIDYSNCCIYKIEHIENVSLVYVGHTTNFTKRKYKHKSNCKNETSKEYNHKVYQMIRENGGWEAFNMIEVEKYSCNDKREASRRENEVMKELKTNMNTIKSYCSREETLERGRQYFENNKESYKEYQEKNKEMYKEMYKDLRKKYYEKNKSQLLEQQKESYINNKEKFKEKHKAYYEKNKEEVKLKSKLFRENNQDKIKEYRKEYHKKNKEVLNLKSKLYRENKKLS